VELSCLNISSKVLTLSLGLAPDIFTLQANSLTTVLLTVNDKLVIQHTLTDQTTNSIFDSFRTDIGDRQAFLDEVHRWKTRWNMVDGQNPQTLLETLNMSQTKTCTPIFMQFLQH
jgi:hypothetical protein